MSTLENVQIVKDFFAALGRRDKQGLLALSAELSGSLMAASPRP
jgi:uncharacterized protein